MPKNEETKTNGKGAGMVPKVGYLLPTRESVMQGRPAAGPLLKLAERAEELRYDSIWIPSCGELVAPGIDERAQRRERAKRG